MKRGPRIVTEWKCMILQNDMLVMQPKDIMKELKLRNVIADSKDKKLYDKIREFVQRHRKVAMMNGSQWILEGSAPSEERAKQTDSDSLIVESKKTKPLKQDHHKNDLKAFEQDTEEAGKYQQG